MLSDEQYEDVMQLIGHTLTNVFETPLNTILELRPMYPPLLPPDTRSLHKN